MDLNINIKLTCDDYMVRLVDTVVRSLDAIDGAVAPVVKVPEKAPAAVEAPLARKAVPAVPAAVPQQEAPKAAETQQAKVQAPTTAALFPPAPEASKTPAPKPEKVNLPELRALTGTWLRADKANHQAALKTWLTQQGLGRVSDISTAAQAEALKLLIKGA